MRARVLKVEGQQVWLGVYYQGEWWRMPARTRIPLIEGDWIEGSLVFGESGEEVHFRIDESAPIEKATPSSEGRLDLEA